MLNPWLDIPLEDYEGHMGSDNVQALSGLFKRVLDICVPESLAILGVAGGNGMQRIDPATTKRTVGLDINPRYLEAVLQRYGAMPGLELHCVDLTGEYLNLEPVELVHAALLFEHTGLGRCLENALRLVALGGKFSVVLQLPSKSEQDVTVTQYSSMQRLRQTFELIDVLQFCKELEEKGFRLVKQEQRSLPSGKAFWLGIFARQLL